MSSEEKEKLSLKNTLTKAEKGTNNHDDAGDFLFRFLAENSTDMISRHNVEGKFIYVSPACRVLLGYEPEEMVGRMAFEFIHPDDIKLVENSRQNITQQSVLSTVEYRYRCKNGEYIWLESTSHTVTDPKTGSIVEIQVSSREITQRKVDEKILQESRANLAALIENTSESIWSVNTSYELINLNTAFVQAFKVAYGVELSTGMNIIGILPPGLREEWKSYYDRAFEKERFAFEQRFDFPNIVIYVEIAMNPIITDGVVIGASVFSRNITDRKMAEQALRESEEKYRNLVDNSLVGVFRTTLEGQILYINSTLAEIIEVDSFDEIKELNSFLLYKDLTQRKDLLNKIKENGKVTGYELNAVTRKGNEKVLLVNITLINGILDGTLIDISYRKSIELALQQERGLLKSIMETSPVGIVSLDKDGNIIYANSRGIEILDLSKGTVTQRTYNAPVWKITDCEGNDFPVEKLPFVIVKTTKQPCYNVQHAITGDSGKMIVLSINAAPLHTDTGEFDGMIASLEDITERKNAERKIQQQNSELQELNASKDRFFSILAHDLRGPMGSLRMISQILTENFDEYQVVKIKELIKTIDNIAGQTYTLLDNLLEWSQVQNGKISPNIQNHNARELVAEIIALFNDIAANKNIIISNYVLENVFILCDANITRTILRNLISNAVKFTDNKGTVTIRSEEKQSLIEFSVQDTGKGIAPAKIPGLFDINSNETTLGTAKEKGTGIGLPLCKELVEKQGGTISVNTELGKGSTFYFTVKEV